MSMHENSASFATKKSNMATFAEVEGGGTHVIAFL